MKAGFHGGLRLLHGRPVLYEAGDGLMFAQLLSNDGAEFSGCLSANAEFGVARAFPTSRPSPVSAVG